MVSDNHNIHITKQQEDWIQSQLSSGSFETSEEYVQYLVDKEIEREKKRAILHAEIQKGLDSGVSNRSIDEIFDSVLARKEKQNGNI